MMEKSWKALLYFALNEVQPFSEDEEESTPMKRTHVLVVHQGKHLPAHSIGFQTFQN